MGPFQADPAGTTPVAHHTQIQFLCRWRLIKSCRYARGLRLRTFIPYVYVCCLFEWVQYKNLLNCFFYIAYVFIYLIACVFIHHVIRVIASVIDCFFWSTANVWLFPNFPILNSLIIFLTELNGCRLWRRWAAFGPRWFPRSWRDPQNKNSMHSCQKSIW